MKSLFVVIFLSLSCLGSLGLAQVRCEQTFLSVPMFDSESSWTLQSLQSEFKVLADFFIKNKNTPDELKIQALMDQDLRKSFFRFEAIGHMLEAQNPKFFAAKRFQFKALEDVLGKLDLATSLRQTAEKINEPELAGFFSQQEAQAKTEILVKMKDSGFWTEPEATIAKLKDKFEKKGHWMTGKKERKFLVSTLADYAKDLHKDVKADKFENPEIEKGLHELRRRLRWVVMQVIALNGLVEFKSEDKLRPDIHAWFEELQNNNPKILQSKYIKDLKVLVDKPLQIPQYEFAMISELVAKVGDLKSDAEMQIYFAEALESLSVGASQKNKILEKLNQLLNVQQVDHQALARETQAQLAASKLLKKYAEKLEAMND